MLEILYDDGPVLVVNKTAGLLTQAPRGINSAEVQVREFFREREVKPKDANLYVGIVHRLDRPVSGALTFTRHTRAAKRLAAQFEQRTVDKTYWAVVEGILDEDEGKWTDHLHKRHGMAQSIVVPEGDPRGKIAILRYRVRQRMPDLGERGATWIEIALETGRTHQIRVQASSRGHAVLGDHQYEAMTPFGPVTDEPRDRGIALHARELVFCHPMRDETVAITASLPNYWQPLALAYKP